MKAFLQVLGLWTAITGGGTGRNQYSIEAAPAKPEPRMHQAEGQGCCHSGLRSAVGDWLGR